jgi:DNA-directed RNA polymerase specialized sigma24 family protein
VVILPVKGYTPKQIAEAMQISLSSVRKHLQLCAKRVKAKSAEEFQQMLR